MAAGGGETRAEGCAVGCAVGNAGGLTGGRMQFPMELGRQNSFSRACLRGPETCVPVPIQIDRAGSDSTEFSRPAE